MKKVMFIDVPQYALNSLFIDLFAAGVANASTHEAIPSATGNTDRVRLTSSFGP